MRNRQPRLHLLSKSIRPQEVSFWAALVLLNALLWAPAYVLDFQSAAASTLSSTGADSSPVWRSLLLGGSRWPVMGLNAEVLIIAAVWAYFAPLRGRLGKLSAVTIYVCILAFQLYAGIVQTLYGDQTNFFAHYQLARDGLPYLFSHLNLPIAVYLAAVGLLAGLMWALIRLFSILNVACMSDSLSRLSRAAVVALAAIAVLAALVAQPAYAGTATVGASATLDIGITIGRSLALRQDMQAFAGDSFAAAAGLKHGRLVHKPDVYVIFIESYGSVLLRRPDFTESYRQLATDLEPQLAEAGWHAVSGLSESPTWGGGSWMAYTSALFGTRIDEHPQYLELLEEYGDSDTVYPGLAHYLQRQGYATLWLSPIAKELTDSKWERYRRFYSVDTWLRHRDFEYKGTQYGWGPAPPDQYVLSYARANYVQAADRPVLTMYITQNSHFPYHTPAFVEDWRELNGESLPKIADGEEEPDHQQLRANYMGSIEYEMQMLTDFILQGEKDSIYVLIGDHQPPRVSRRDDSFDTPIHFVTRDPGTADLFRERGFVTGLLPGIDDKVMAHEALYPLLLELLHEYEPQ